jgi:hypothetical protein
VKQPDSHQGSPRAAQYAANYKKVWKAPGPRTACGQGNALHNGQIGENPRCLVLDYLIRQKAVR